MKSENRAIGWAFVQIDGVIYVLHLWPDGTVTRRPPTGGDCTVRVEMVSLPVVEQVISSGGDWPKDAFMPNTTVKH